MIGSRIGDPVANRTSHLVQSKTVTGEACVRLDRNCDDKDTTRDAVLVTRINAHADWQPVKNVEELEKFLATANEDDKRHNLGQWKDKRSNFWLTPADGQVQPKEVKTMMDHHLFEKATLHSRSEETHPKYGGPEVEGAYYVRVDPGQTNVSVENGQKVYNEPVVVSDSYITRTTEWAQDGPYHIPMGFKHFEYHLFK